MLKIATGRKQTTRPAHLPASEHVINAILVQQAPAALDRLHARMRALLPEELFAKVELYGQEPEEISSYPMIIAFAQLSPEEFAVVEAALKECGAAQFALERDGLIAAPLDPDAPDERTPAEILMLSAAETERARRVDAELNAAADELIDLVTAPHSGIDWPELHYTDEEKAAYDAVLKQLHPQVPHEDQGEHLELTDITRLKRPRHVSPSAWRAVTEHIYSEVKYFKQLNRWFWDNGHFTQFCRDRFLMDLAFVSGHNLQSLISVDDGKEVKLMMDTLCDVVGEVLKQFDVPGKIAALAIKLGTRVAKSQMPDYKSIVSAQIGRLHDELAERFSKQLSGYEKARQVLATDWGKLQTFGAWVQNNDLRWPKSTEYMRASAMRAYQTYVLSTLLRHGRWRWVIAEMKVVPREKGDWSWTSNSHLQSYSTRRCGADRIFEYYVGEVKNGFFGKELTAGPKALHEKMFGRNTTNPVNPQFALPPAFLHKLDKGEAKNTWGLGAYKTHEE